MQNPEFRIQNQDALYVRAACRTQTLHVACPPQEYADSLPLRYQSLITESPTNVGYWSDEWRIGEKSWFKLLKER